MDLGYQSVVRGGDDDFERLIADHIDMLMRRGACITRAGLTFYPLCLSMFQNSNRSLGMIRDLPAKSVQKGFLSHSQFGLHVLLTGLKVELTLRRLAKRLKRREYDDTDYLQGPGIILTRKFTVPYKGDSRLR